MVMFAVFPDKSFLVSRCLRMRITDDLSEAVSLADRVVVLSGRPATVKKEISIHLTLQDDSPLAARNAPEFNEYFNQLWEEMKV